MEKLVVLSHFQAAVLLKLRESIGNPINVSLDLNISHQQGVILPDGVELEGIGVLRWEDLWEIAATSNNCFSFKNGIYEKILVFSELTNSTYSLYPTESAPTMLVSGIPMHRIKNTTPDADTRQKIKAAQPTGRVLDTATGLGYTAIAAAKTAEHVTTVELDPAAQQICRLNPWSQELFANHRIEQRIGDSFDVIETIQDTCLDRIIHDPPTFSLAGHLYSRDFYSEMHRVLKPGGKVFHYIGDPDSKSGRRMTAGSIQRLKQVGFKQVNRVSRAFGVVAVK